MVSAPTCGLVLTTQLTLGKVLQEGLDPFHDDIGREDHTSDRIKESPLEQRADILLSLNTVSRNREYRGGLTGNASDMRLKTTSFSASCASACTPEEGMREHQTHLPLVGYNTSCTSRGAGDSQDSLDSDRS